MPNSKLYNIKTTLTDGTVIDSGTIEVPQGEKGDTGLSALTYGGGVIPVTSNPPTTVPTFSTTSFNRTPVVGDSFLALAQYTGGQSQSNFVLSCKISTVSGSNCSATINGYIDTTGQGSSAPTIYQGMLNIQSSTCMLRMTIMAQESFNYTGVTDLINFLGQNGFTSSTNSYPVIGVARTSDTSEFKNVRSIYVNDTSLVVLYSDTSSPELAITLSQSTLNVSTIVKNIGSWLYI